MEQGFCVRGNGADQNGGVRKLSSVNMNTDELKESCLQQCIAYRGATGCEVIYNTANQGCYVHTRNIARGNNVANHNCWVFTKCKGKY